MSDDLTRILQFEALCDTVFSPSTPINKLSLFVGRSEQIQKLRGAISTRGDHAIIYGDKGVGKTSLASVLKDMFAKIDTVQVSHINCDSADDFQNAWRKALAELCVWVEVPAEGEEPGQPDQLQRYALNEYMSGYPVIGPGEIKHLLQWATSSHRLVIVFDEFNQLPEPERAMFAHTIKNLSDHAASVDATIVLVGVASDTAHLIAEHSSVTRCLRQIQMPMMSRQDLREIIDRALPKLSMTIARDAVTYITSLSQGLPNYTHLIGKEASLKAFRSGRRHITADDVLASVGVALEQVDLSIRTIYHQAITGLRAGELFPQVLLACALAPTDPLGWFRATNVRPSLCRITGEDYNIADFLTNLEKLTTDERGNILTRTGVSLKHKYRFSDPLMRPFIILKRIENPNQRRMILDALLDEDGPSSHPVQPIRPEKPKRPKPGSNATHPDLFDDT